MGFGCIGNPLLPFRVVLTRPLLGSRRGSDSWAQVALPYLLPLGSSSEIVGLQKQSQARYLGASWFWTRV